MKVLPSHTGEAAQRPATTRVDKASASTFKAALAQASTDAPADITLRKGESMQAVEGHAYAEITGGKRSGMFVNTSGNVRHGEAFVRVLRDGKEYHIYGSGKDRVVVGFHIPKSAPEAPDTSGLDLKKGETISPVDGHGYAEITSGPRAGMFINTSGNRRHGEAFVLVQKDGVDYHIYGSGKDREVVGVRPSDEDDDK